MIYLETNSTDPYYNLAFEEYVFSAMDPAQPYCMLWQNENTIVVGKYQNTAEEVNQSFVDAHGIRVARRLSGGGAVYHDAGNLNFTFITDQDKAADFNFQVFVIPVVEALAELGVKAAFNGRNDITIDGKKFSGNSQYSRKGRVMHHGCIMLDSNLTNVADALRVKDAKFDSKSVKSVRSRVTTINAHAPAPIPMERFKQCLKEQIAANDRLVDGMLSPRQLADIQRLRDEKYASWEWNYGHSANYTVRREQRFSAGTVTAMMDVQKGRIERILFAGDFFGNGELSELEQSLEGVALDEKLEAVLAQRNVGQYIHGITPSELGGLLRC